jgi:DNA-binding beta-propeller fold protein YncE
MHSLPFDSTKFSSWKMNTGLAPTPLKEQLNINNNVAAVCSSCTSGDFVKAHCSQCGNLCDNCRTAHELMHCFEGHEVEPINNNVPAVCSSCTSGDFVKAQCSQCGYLCDNCRMAHQFMHCFEGHEVEPVSIPSSQSKCQKNSPTTSIMPMTNNSNNEDENDLDNHMYQVYPPRSHIKRQKMIYYCKFGEFGVIEGQFTEPSGVAVNCQNDVIVADTNNHRIQVFDREGRFKFQFGECGKRDGQLLYPNRVSVNRVTGDFIVTERSPTHQIQIFNQYGQFMRKFGANILQHPRGVCVDSQGRIIVVECKVMRVIIFDTYGNVLQKFSCSRYLEFPNGVCATPNNEILISDNRAHCIKVFSYEGQYLRQIGGEGITNYPIGVGMNGNGEVIVADNHNNFNLTIFDQKGNMLNALESKVKHAQCFDMALIDDGSVVLASKDYRLYLYRYSHPLTV